MNFEEIILGESQLQKDKYYTTVINDVSKVVKFYKNRK